MSRAGLSVEAAGGQRPPLVPFSFSCKVQVEEQSRAGRARRGEARCMWIKARCVAAKMSVG